MEARQRKKHNIYIRYVVSFLILIGLLGILTVWSVNSGSVDLSMEEIGDF